MKTYAVRIMATVIKTICVKAADEEEATVLAHEEFTVAPEHDEAYEEETLSVHEVYPEED